MFCPNCGQRRASKKLRYCPRCGFSLRGVLSVRRKDIVQGLLLIFIGLVFIRGFTDFVAGVVSGWREAWTDGVTPQPFAWSAEQLLYLFSAVFFIWGLSRIAFAVFVEWNSRLRRQREALSATLPAAQLSASPPAAFPHARDVPIVELNERGPNTQELAKSSGDPEEPTRFLEN